MSHCRYMSANHPWHWSRLHDGKLKMNPTPQSFFGDDILEQFEKVDHVILGKNPTKIDKKRKRIPSELNWTKGGIFF